ncbi:MAG: ribosomal protein S18-alanine N-acetyltransferase [bacterium]
MNQHIRKMTMDDLDDVMQIEESSFSAPWSRYTFEFDLLHNPHASYFVIMKDGLLVGYAGLWIFEPVGHIINMAVVDEFRHQKLASAMLEHVIEFGWNTGVESFTLEVRESNKAAIELYQSHGFINVGIRPRYYDDNDEDALIMRISAKEGKI